MSKVEKAIKKFTKGTKQLQEVYLNKSLEDFKTQLVQTLEIYRYPEANSPFARVCPWIIVPVDAPYKPSDIPGIGDPGEDYMERGLSKTFDSLPEESYSKAFLYNMIKQKVDKAVKNFNKGFKLLKSKDEDLFDKLGLLEAKDTINFYATDLMDSVLGNERVLEEDHPIADRTIE